MIYKGIHPCVRKSRNRQSRHQKPVPKSQASLNRIRRLIETFEWGVINDGDFGDDAGTDCP